MARRWIITAIVTAVLVVAAIAAARAIRDDTNTAARDRVTTVTTAPSTTGAATTSTPTGTPTTSTPAPATTTVAPADGQPPGPCGADTAAIRAAIDAGVTGAQAGADLASCRLAASDTTWAAAQLAAKPGAQFDARTAILHRSAGAWAVVASGGTSAGCGQAPQQVLVDLGQFCAGTGGGGA